VHQCTAAAAGRGLDVGHVDAFHVGALLAIRLDGHVIAVEELGDLFALEAFAPSRGTPSACPKGAYLEPATVAFPRKGDVDRSYLELTRYLLQHGVYPALATHDEAVIRQICRFVADRQIPLDSFEFQMLHGIRRDVQRRLVAGGYHVRLYVPFGKAWYPYYMRRLAERPANVFFMLRNLFRR
jgi:proline dehydrogenase